MRIEKRAPVRGAASALTANMVIITAPVIFVGRLTAFCAAVVDVPEIATDLTRCVSALAGRSVAFRARNAASPGPRRSSGGGGEPGSSTAGSACPTRRTMMKPGTCRNPCPSPPDSPGPAGRRLQRGSRHALHRDREAIQHGVTRERVEGELVGEAGAVRTCVHGGDAGPGVREVMPPAVGDAHHARHDGVGHLDRQLDRAHARRDARELAAGDPEARGVRRVELRGWLVQRPGSLLPGGRPVVEQDTALGDVLPLGPGLHAFRTVEEAAAALGAVEADYARASAHAAAVAREYFAAERVLGALRRVAGLCRGLGPSTGRSRSPTRRRSA